MQTSDFEKIGTFYSNGEKITFISLAEEVFLRKDRDFISENQFKKLDSPIDAVFIEKEASIIENINIAKGLRHCSVPVFRNGIEFPLLLGIDFIEPKDSIDKYANVFPASQVCKALALSHEDDSPWDTEQRLVLVDYTTKMPQYQDDIVVYPRVIKGFKTIFPKSFDTWVKVLLKTREFKTINKEYLLLKSLFKIK